MSRVKDLRDLICVSRLTIRENDDDVIFSDEDLTCRGSARNTSLGKTLTSASESLKTTFSPDSGFATNGQPESDSQNSENDLASSLKEAWTSAEQSEVNGRDYQETMPQTKQKKKKTKSRLQQTTSDGPLLKTSSHPHLYSARKAVPGVLKVVPGVLKNELLSISHHRVDSGAFGDRSETPSVEFSEGHFEKLLMYIDGAVISGWLEQANENVEVLTNWCHTGNNFIEFSHFWLSKFTDKERFEIFHLEYSILLDHLYFAFEAGLTSRKIQKHHVSMFLNAVFREYPARLMSSQGAHLFLNYLDILSSSKKLEYRHLLSDVRCSTQVPDHIQWILSTRSFAIVSVWLAVIDFYRQLTNDKEVTTPSTPSLETDSDDGLHLQRIYTAISRGYDDVVHYLMITKKVAPNACDKQQKSLAFYAIIHKQRKILKMLLTQTKYKVDGNHPSCNGNTPLHAAVNMGSKELVEELLTAGKVKVDVCNPQCDNATPLHLAILHGHLEIVHMLIAAGADRAVKMNKMTAVDLAREFGQEEILQFLLEDSSNLHE